MSSWGSYSIDISGFSGCCNPTHIALLPSGDIVTSEKGTARVKLFDESGNYKGLVAGPSEFPHDWTGLDLAVNDAGRILVLAPKARIIRVYRRTGSSGG